jgi:hypothetical protein
MATIVVDTNAGENGVFAGLLSAFGAERVTRKRLDLGDIEVTGSFGKIVFERKGWNDLVSSLRDGRYGKFSSFDCFAKALLFSGTESSPVNFTGEQKARLLAERERAAAENTRLRVVYLIESARVPAYDDKTHGVPNNQPFAALTKMALRDGIAIIFCATDADGAKNVAYAVRAAEQGGLDSAAHAEEVAAHGYAGTVKHSNKRKNADEAPFEVMLTALTGVSGKKAKAVTAAYPSPVHLVRAYVKLDATGAAPKALDNMLADLSSGDKRLGPALSRKLRSVFFPEDAQVSA